MATQLITRFNSWGLSEEEELRGSVYTLEQLWVLQNHLAEAALSKNSLTLDPEHPLVFAQQESYQAGRVELIEYLLEAHEAAVNRLDDITRNAHQPT